MADLKWKKANPNLNQAQHILAMTELRQGMARMEMLNKDFKKLLNETSTLAKKMY